MIANFWITKFKNQLINSELSPDKFYSVNFVNINLVFDKSLVKTKIYEIQTNLIDRSGFNPMRTVTFFCNPSGENVFTYSPTQKIFYKLSLSNFNAPLFIVRCIESGDIIDFRDISVQLEIRETNGWF